MADGKHILVTEQPDVGIVYLVKQGDLEAAMNLVTLYPKI